MTWRAMPESRDRCRELIGALMLARASGFDVDPHVTPVLASIVNETIADGPVAVAELVGYLLGLATVGFESYADQFDDLTSALDAFFSPEHLA